MCIRYGLVAGLLACLQVTGAYSLPLNWSNTATGPAAGDWFVATNWNLFSVPTSTDTARISNGGEAKADISTAVGSVVAKRLEVGKNSSTGIFTDSGVAINVGVDFDMGEVGGNFAAGPVVVNSNGTATISDAPSLQVGTTGVGDLDIGQTSATLGAQAFGTGAVTIQRVPLVTVQDSVDVGRTSGTAQAAGNGSLTVNDVNTFSIGASLSVGETSSSVGIKNAQGIANLSLVGGLTVGTDFVIGRSLSAGGQDTSNGTATISNSGAIFVSNDLDAGSASVTAGGTANATGSLTVQTVSSLTVDNLIGVGNVRGTSGSGQVDALGNATILDVNTISISRDLFVGRIFTKDNVRGSANGNLTIERSSSLSIGADFDVGQTGTTGISAGGPGNTVGTASATVRDITGTVSIAGNFDVGLTSSVANSVAQGNGTLLLERLGALEVGIDFNVGQTGGAGQATGTGFVTIVDTPSITVGEDFDIGRTSGSAGGVSSGNGTVSISDATVSVGFGLVNSQGDFNGDFDIDGDDFLAWQRGFGTTLGASKVQGDSNLDGKVDQADLTNWESAFGNIGGPPGLTPGSLNVGEATVVANEQASAFGRATFTRVSLSVADRINVGGLAGGGINPLTGTDGLMTWVASSVSAPVVDVAVVLAGTAGTATGQLRMDSSLLNVSGPLTLGGGATLTLDLAGTTRADGTGNVGQYSAIDATSITLGGVLEIALTGGYTPLPGDFFDLLKTTGTLGGSFSSQVLPALAPNLSWNLVQTTNLLRLEVQGLPAISSISTQVPEPSSWFLAILAGAFFGSLRDRQQKVVRCLHQNMRVFEQ